MDKCREEFEAYIVTRYPKRSKEMVTRRLEEIDGYQFYTFKEIEDAWVIWQHQQAKVEELEKEWLEMNQQHEKAVKECFEVNSENRKLQKQVDAVKQVISKIRNGNYANDQGEGVAKFIAGMLEQALKGEGQ